MPSSEQRIADVASQAVHDAGAEIVTCVPAPGASQVFEAARALKARHWPYSLHPETAYTIAMGASLVGARACALLSVHAFAKACNAALDSLACGVQGGLVALAFDDRLSRLSESLVDTAALLNGWGVPHSFPEPADIYDEIAEGFGKSEMKGLPFAIVLDADGLARNAVFERRRAAAPRRNYERDPSQNCLGPFFAAYQKEAIEVKRAGGDRRRMARPPAPPAADAAPPEWRPCLERLGPIFEELRRVRGAFVAADAGPLSLFALPPFDCVDAAAHQSSSLPLAVGAAAAGARNVWAVTTALAFAASGHLGLAEADARGLVLKTLVIRDPSLEPESDPIDAALARLSRNNAATVKCGSSLQRLRTALKDAAAADQTRVLIADLRPARS
ncbi:MAG TPA: hypothetical protein P5137_06915 [Candidatus Brocadiia bacterium]|nr:hypothetical protein [Candidatus Brocadiia bacterium]